MLQDLLAIQCWPLWIRVALMWVGLGAAYLVQIPMERRRGCGAVWNFPLTGANDQPHSEIGASPSVL